jgi:hypothetical protein
MRTSAVISVCNKGAKGIRFCHLVQNNHLKKKRKQSSPEAWLVGLSFKMARKFIHMKGTLLRILPKNKRTPNHNTSFTFYPLWKSRWLQPE